MWDRRHCRHTQKINVVPRSFSSLQLLLLLLLLMLGLLFAPDIALNGHAYLADALFAATRRSFVLCVCVCSRSLVAHKRRPNHTHKDRFRNRSLSIEKYSE